MGPSSHMVAFLFILWLQSVSGRHLRSSREDFGNRLVNTQNPSSAAPEAHFGQIGSVTFAWLFPFYELRKEARIEILVSEIQNLKNSF